MSNHKKYNKYIIATIIIISLATNLLLSVKLISLKKKVISSSNITSMKLERAIRDTMYSIKELNNASDDDSNEEELLNNLQLSMSQLLLIFNNWVDLNQSEKNPKQSLEEGLSALESLRNTIVYHLGNQYSNNGQLTHYDTVLLEKVYKKLDRLLTIYDNLEKRTEKIKDIEGKMNVGLSQWAQNMEEICKLYRHSRIPNEHLNYIELDVALSKADKIFPTLKNFKGLKEIDETVQIKDGVHYYEISYYLEEEPAEELEERELAYLIWIDAVNGSLRLFEDYTENYNGAMIFKKEALNIAKNFVDKLKIDKYDEVIETVSIITDVDSNNDIYAFEFIPILEDTTIVSDCVNMSISSIGGNIIKYSNNFNGTEIPSVEPIVPLEDIEEKYEEQLADAEYSGLSVVRSFYTHYNPVIAYNYKLKKEEKTTRLYFDVVTGNQVYEFYSVHKPIHYITAEIYGY